jgi:iron complex transport system ATP-binding protein
VSMLRCDAVAVRYGRREAVAPFTDTLARGDWVCVIGANGAGKSSLLRAIAGLVPHSGTVTVNDVDLDSRRPRVRAASVAYVPQDPQMPPDMTAFEYVLLGRTPYISYFGIDTEKDRRTVRDVLVRLDLADFGSRPLGTLSGGERQRLVIARALAQEAPVLLLDEPTSALDIGHQQQALELVDALRGRSGLTVVSAMHDLTLAGLYADRLLLMDAGAVVESGSAAEVLRPDTLKRFYGAEVDVVHAADGTVVVVPRRVPGGVSR